MILQKLKLLIFTILLSTLYSCGQNAINKDHIIGKWKVTEYNLHLKKDMDISPAIIEEAKKNALSSSYDFKEDNTYSFISSFESYKGTWTLVDKNIVMNYSSEYEKKGIQKYEVVNLGNDKMTWKTESEFEKSKTVLSKQ